MLPYTHVIAGQTKRENTDLEQKVGLPDEKKSDKISGKLLFLSPKY